MESADWKQLLRIGVAEIDNEHLLIMQMIGRLRKALEESDRESLPEEITLSTLKRLVAYVREHFAAEEAIMKNAQYPDFDRHRREHELFLEHLVEVEKTEAKENAASITEFLNSLSNWLHHHVLEMDKRLGFFLLEKSVAIRKHEE